MGVAQVAQSQARRALLDAVADVNAQHARQVAIGRGLLGAALNALAKGLSREEVGQILRDHGGAAILLSALRASPDAVSQQQETALNDVVALANIPDAENHDSASGDLPNPQQLR